MPLQKKKVIKRLLPSEHAHRQKKNPFILNMNC